MNAISRKLILIIGLLGFAVSNVTSAFACRCAPMQTPLEGLKQSNAVFAGKVTDVYSVMDAKHPDVEIMRFNFQVSKVWKGLKCNTITLTTTNMCAYPFEEGREYIVYATNAFGDVLTAITCSKTQLLSKADRDLAELGEGWTPSSCTPQQSHEDALSAD